MSRLSGEALALVLGVVLLFVGWFTSFLLVIFSNQYSVYLSILSYVISLAGLVLASYGYASVILKKRGKE